LLQFLIGPVKEENARASKLEAKVWLRRPTVNYERKVAKEVWGWNQQLHLIKSSDWV